MDNSVPTQAAGKGGGGILKSNKTSSDNPLSFGNYYSQENSQGSQQSFNKQGNPAPNPGGILKSNFSSSENPLANPNYYPQQNNNFTENSSNNFNESQQYVPTNYNYTSSARPSSPPNINSNSGPSFPASAPVYQNPNVGQSLGYTPNYDTNNLASPRYSHQTSNIKDIRFDVPNLNKQAYKQALDQQVAEKQFNKFNQEKQNLNSEIDSLSTNPFGRRIDPANYMNVINPTSADQQAQYKQLLQQQKEKQNQLYQQQSGSSYPGYVPSFYNRPFDEPVVRLNKDNIIEKPNSLSNDLPPYDPIKHKTGQYQGYNYDPWGKPGGGAPLIDATTGRKFTKMSGQVWYDQIGLNPDDRAKIYADKNRPLTLEEQKQNMEAERERRKFDEAIYKSRAGDVATWITEIERQKKLYSNDHNAAHLGVTNVTRDKINLESVRRYNVNEANKSSKQYHDDLSKQVEELNRQNKLKKLKDDVAGIEHTRKWDDWWGKPGGGAPRGTNGRFNLESTLESPREKFNGTSLPIEGNHFPAYYRNSEKLLFPKSTQSSNHKNFYDNQQPMKL